METSAFRQHKINSSPQRHTGISDNKGPDKRIWFTYAAFYITKIYRLFYRKI
jgi:hypothetical protein